MFNKILIANRGEIALRILRSCRELGIATVVVHSTADADAMHVRLADESVCIGPPQAAQSYLNIPSILAACEITGADAVHPGYGFLSENGQFAQILEEHSIAFIGPSYKHIKIMGDKIEAKKTATNLGIPVVPGSSGNVTNVSDAKRIAAEIGYPVLMKAAAGGGGKGMKVVNSEKEIDKSFQTTRMEAKASFNNDEIYIEKYLANPHHIEVQIIGDGNGSVVHLGERDCSLQRRHQKLLEEAPSPIISNDERSTITKTVVKGLAEMGYRGAGTVEFLYENGQFYFIEMNTRLQVEHPVTEEVTGVDIVAEQIFVASEGKLSFKQKDVTINGHAIECRINAENPATFLPSPGQISYYHPPGGPGIRMDSGIFAGYRIPPYYDSLIGKLIVHGKDRKNCLAKLQRALNEMIVDGVDTTIPLFKSLLNRREIINGEYDVHWLENNIKSIQL